MSFSYDEEELQRKLGRGSVCSGKVKYDSQYGAEQAATSHNKRFKENKGSYYCYFCGGFHFGRRMSIDEIKRILNKP